MDFDMLGLKPRLVAKLAKHGIKDPTPIQAQAIPHVMNGRDIMGLAQTGTGKTIAFGLPLSDALLRSGDKPASGTARSLILAPTRELAAQIAENLRMFTEGSHLSVALVVGGAGIRGQIAKMQRGVDLLVATPGRLIDLLDRRAISLSETRYLVLDEADQMLDMGFIHALRKIAPLLPDDRQTMLFSATMPKNMAEIASTYLNNPVRIEVSRPGQAADKVTQVVHFVEQTQKTKLLISLLDQHRTDRALVFARTKHGAERLMKNLVKAGFGATSVHGNKSQGQRERAISEFKSGKTPILVATDVAARGIDIPDVKFVYNYELPNVAENYVHRIGRTARAGKDGAAVAFCSPVEMDDLYGIEKAMKAKIKVASGTPFAPEAPPSRAKKPQGRRGGGGFGGGGGGRSQRSRGRNSRAA